MVETGYLDISSHLYLYNAAHNLETPYFQFILNILLTIRNFVNYMSTSSY